MEEGAGSRGSLEKLKGAREEFLLEFPGGASPTDTFVWGLQTPELEDDKHVLFVPRHRGRGNWLEQLQATNRTTAIFVFVPPHHVLKTHSLMMKRILALSFLKKLIYFTVPGPIHIIWDLPLQHRAAARGLWV